MMRGIFHPRAQPPCALISVDLGKWVCGIAALDASGLVLRATELEPVADVPATAPGPRMVSALMEFASERTLGDPLGVPWVCEEMVDYRDKLGRGGSLDDLREVARLLRDAGVQLKEIKARAWKGQVPKRIIFDRLYQKLSREELIAVSPWTKESLDAVGIGVVHSGRFSRGIL